MTSSLVGSEMCIRDSLGAPGGTDRRGGPSRDERGLPHRSWSWQKKLLGCLLYTSDAADDM
eukprot:10534498-Prorocentrum_lima.AAC.1